MRADETAHKFIEKETEPKVQSHKKREKSPWNLHTHTHLFNIKYNWSRLSTDTYKPIGQILEAIDLNNIHCYLSLIRFVSIDLDCVPSSSTPIKLYTHSLPKQ